MSPLAKIKEEGDSKLNIKLKVKLEQITPLTKKQKERRRCRNKKEHKETEREHLHYRPGRGFTPHCEHTLSNCEHTDTKLLTANIRPSTGTVINKNALADAEKDTDTGGRNKTGNLSDPTSCVKTNNIDETASVNLTNDTNSSPEQDGNNPNPNPGVNTNNNNETCGETASINSNSPSKQDGHNSTNKQKDNKNVNTKNISDDQQLLAQTDMSTDTPSLQSNQTNDIERDTPIRNTTMNNTEGDINTQKQPRLMQQVRKGCSRWPTITQWRRRDHG